MNLPSRATGDERIPATGNTSFAGIAGAVSARQNASLSIESPFGKPVRSDPHLGNGSYV